MAWYDAITSGVGSAVDKVDNFIDTKVVPFRLPNKGVAMFNNPLEYFKQDFYPNVVEDSNLFVDKSTANDYTQERGLWSPGLGSAPYVPPVESFSGLGPIIINGGPENIIQGQNNGMTSAQQEALTSMGNYNAFNANQQIDPAGTSSPDGMMTMPTLPLYPGEAIGIDGVPYRPSAGQNNNPSSYSYEPNQGGSSAGSSTPVADVLGTRQFNQRAPSGSIYAPDMSEYNNSSLFNYTGQGGVPEYTYGQGLRTGGAYSEYGTPADMANPYFSGQFKVPDTIVNPINTGPADAAINMNPVVMPAGVPAIGGGSGTTTANPLDQGKYMGNPNHYNSGQDLSYKQTIDSMGIFGPNNPPPSTPFPSPGGATTLANMGLTERQIAQMSPQQQAYMTQTLADQTRMQQGQINKNREIANIASSPDTSMMENQAAADMAMGNRTGYPNQVVDRTTEILAAAEANGGVIDGTEVVDGNTGIDAFRESFLRDRSLDREQQNVYGGLDGMFGPYGLHNNEPEGIFAGMPPERDSFKADEIDIPTPPFVPEGQEGVDYYQDVTGDYFAMEDDLGTQSLKPGNMADDTSPFTTDYSEPINVFAGMPPERDFFKSDEAGIDKPANLSSYEIDGDIESTSNNMGALSDSFAAIDAKYAGSTTEASGVAELGDVIGVIADEFLGMTIEDTNSYTPSPAETDYPLAYQSYAREDEGTITGESLFQNVATPSSPTGTVYPGANKPLDPSNRIDQVVAQAMAQQAQIQAAAAREPDVKVTPANVASIFNPRPSGPPSMAQIKPMVAKTQNNMTVPTMRDAALTKRYGNPYSRYGL